MAATPKTGVLKLVSEDGLREYNISVYDSDVAAAFLRFSKTGLATSSSLTEIYAPEDCFTGDLSVTTGIVDTSVLVPYANDSAIPGGQVIAWANCSNANPLSARAVPRIHYKKGTKIQFVEA